MIYLDHAATSYPKPIEVIESVKRALEESANPGRSSHKLAIDTAREIFMARRVIANHINADSSKKIIFTKNCTEALNIAIFGAVSPGDHVITTCFEHNSILRPLHALKERGVDLTIVEPSSHKIEPEDIFRAITPNTTMVVLSHIENLTGLMVDIRTIGRALPENILFLVDAAQSLGSHNIDVEDCHIDLLAAPGHKGLMGPMGIGFLYVRDEMKLTPMIVGGTGSKSQSLIQPDFSPDKFEAGTPNAPGIIGLKTGVEYIEKIGVKNIDKKIRYLASRFYEGVKDLDKVTVYGPKDESEITGIISITIHGMDSGEISERLDEEFGIATRAQLHCAPLSHLYYKTLETGMVRFSFGYSNELEDVERAISAIKSITEVL